MCWKSIWCGDFEMWHPLRSVLSKKNTRERTGDMPGWKLWKMVENKSSRILRKMGKLHRRDTMYIISPASVFTFHPPPLVSTKNISTEKEFNWEVAEDGAECKDTGRHPPQLGLSYFLTGGGNSQNVNTAQAAKINGSSCQKIGIYTMKTHERLGRKFQSHQ